MAEWTREDSSSDVARAQKRAEGVGGVGREGDGVDVAGSVVRSERVTG